MSSGLSLELPSNLGDPKLISALNDVFRTISQKLPPDATPEQAANLVMNNFRITTLADPLGPQDALNVRSAERLFAQSSPQIAGRPVTDITTAATFVKPFGFEFGIGIDGTPDGLIAVGHKTPILTVPPGWGGTVQSWDSIAVLAPTGANLVCDFQLSTDGGSTWASFFTNPTDRANVPAGSIVSQSGVVFRAVPLVLAPGNLMYGIITQVGSTLPGQGATFNLYAL